MLAAIGEHMAMVFAAMLLTVAAGIPLGVCAYLFRPARRPLLKGIEMLQTVPAMALLGILMVFLGAGKLTVVIGLLLYSLLPVVQNTYTGLAQVDPSIRQAAQGMGMTPLYQMWHVELPLALPMLLAGIRIAAVTAVGIAVFASSVGGGGLGGVIYRGIRIQNMRLILSGALALMLIAVFFYVVMMGAEKLLICKRRGRNRKDG